MWNVDKKGRLAMPGIHDGLVEEMSYLRSKTLKVRILGSDNQLTSVILEKIFVLNIEELWEGSVVDSIYIQQKQELAQVDWTRKDVGWPSLLSGRVLTKDECQAEAERLGRLHPHAKLVSFSCSYGGSWAALCEDVGITQANS